MEEGQFHVYAVGAITEGIEILTGRPAGTADEKGDYPPDTVFGKAQEKLQHYLRQTLKLKACRETPDDEQLE
jgi:hypothetical protein